MDRLDAMKVFVVTLDEGKSRSGRPQTGTLTGGCQPCYRLPREIGSARSYCTARLGRSS